MLGQSFSELRDLSAIWLAPFAGFVLLVALAPIWGSTFWHRNYFRIICLWVAAFIGLFVYANGWQPAHSVILDSLLGNYIPFIIMITTLYVLAGGIYLDYPFQASPVNNAIYLSISAMLASVLGTMGASVLMIRPLIRANINRTRYTHVIVFFIFVVSNIAGGYTPLGDPPLFVGFLNGVDFFWSIQKLFVPCLLMMITLILLFFAIDLILFRSEQPISYKESRKQGPLLQGKINILLLAVLIAAVSLTALWPDPPGIELLSVKIKLNSVIRDLVLLGLIFLSRKFTPASVWSANEFSWRPAIEVGAIFLGVFVTIVPAIIILRAGKDGSLAPLFSLLSRSDGQPANPMYFWLTGALSSFLDNAPTYLIFFNAAGASPAQLMGAQALTLMAISTGAVFMGANTYIGNAPNLMVKTLAEHNGMKMPTFFAYMKWSCCILIPLFLAFDWLYFR
jgi:Na+/H+ antiporter NhaD/arsenite permease-like protein